MSLKGKIFLIIAFVSVICAYSFYQFLWEGAFYHLTALTFVCLNSVIFLLTKGKWKIISLVMLVTSCNNLLDELFFDPTKLDYNEFITLIITIIIVYENYKNRWND